MIGQVAKGSLICKLRVATVRRKSQGSAQNSFRRLLIVAVTELRSESGRDASEPRSRTQDEREGGKKGIFGHPCVSEKLISRSCTGLSPDHLEERSASRTDANRARVVPMPSKPGRFHGLHGV